MRTEYWNGGNIDAAIESLKTVHGLCEFVQKELHGDAIVHPRDYIEGSGSAEYGADVVLWREQLAAAQALQGYCERRVEELCDLRDKHSGGLS